MGFWTKPILNREEYKGFLKLLLQQSNYAPLVRLGLVAVLALATFVCPALTPDALATFSQNGTTYNTDSSTVIRSQGQTSAIDLSGQSGVFTLKFSRLRSTGVVISETNFASVGVADSHNNVIQAIFGDTLDVISSSASGVHDRVVAAGDAYVDTVWLSSDTAQTNDTVSYVLSLTNYSNAPDTLGLIIDTAWLSSIGTDTISTGRFSYQFFNRSGAPLTSILTYAHEDTGKIYLAANASGTAILRVYTTGTANGDTVRAAIRAYANQATGRSSSGSGEVGGYRGFNNIKYGGDGNAAAYVELSVIGPVVRLAKTDTVFAHIGLSGGAADTQNYIPGSLIVYTIWFDNDGTDTADTIVVEDWLDTRYVRFDSMGLSALRNNTGQRAAAAQLIDSNFGNIFIDSMMPSTAGAYRVNIEYAGSNGNFQSLTAATQLELVERIRWTISKSGGVLGLNNADDNQNIDAAPTPQAPGPDADRGCVRFSVVIR